MWIFQALALWVEGKRSRAWVLGGLGVAVVLGSSALLFVRPAGISAAIGDIAVYREATGLELISTSVTTLDWDTTVSEGPGFTIDSGRTDITLSDQGKYLVMYNLGIQIGAGAGRREIQGFLELDSTVSPYGRASCFIRRSDGQDTCHMAGAAILETTAPNQVLRVQAQRTDSNISVDARRTPSSSGLMLLRLDDIWEYARFRKTNTQSANNTSFQTIEWNTDDEIAGIYSRSGGAITLDEPGYYMITTNVGYTLTANARRSLATRLTLDGVEVPGTRVTAFMDGNTNTRNHVATYSGIIEVTAANQVLRLETVCEGLGCGSVSTNGSQTAMTLARLPDSAEIVRLGDTAGTQQIDGNNDPILLNEQQRLDPTFSHSTSTNSSRVTVNTPGAYLFFGSFYSTRDENSGILYPTLRWRVNGGVQNYAGFGQINHGEGGANSTLTAGNSGGFIAPSLSSGAYVELANTNETTESDASAVFAADRMGLQGVRIGSLVIGDALVASEGEQTATTTPGTTDLYLGGAFSVRGTRGNVTITEVTIEEFGTIDAASDLANVRLFYEMDTTAPYTCDEMSYDGTQPQFGTSTTFSSANGTASFSGSVGAGTSSALCLYVVVDVASTALDGQIIEIHIADPSNDVVLSSGTVDPETPIVLGGSTVVEDDLLTQTHYHWRLDDDDEQNASSATAGLEDTPLMMLAKNTTTRLRMQVANSGSAPSPAVAYRLEYAPIAGSCAATVSGWTQVGDSGAAFDMSPTTNLTEGADTTNIPVPDGGVSDEGSVFVTPNGAVRDTTSQTGGIVTPIDGFVEFEFSLEATTDADEGTTYCFRLTDAGTPLVAYDEYPRATVAADVTVSSIGAQVAGTLKNVTDLYLGGAFVISTDTGTRDVTAITVAQTGTADGQTALENLRLYYDLDTTAPYDCSSESYDGTQAQFGATSSIAFNASQGTSTFTDSVTISPSQTLCVYAVLDITNNAGNADTIEIEVTNPASDVVVSSGSVAPTTPIELMGATVIEGETLVQYGYHWRNDTGDEQNATSATGGNQSTPLTNTPQGAPHRLRLGVQNVGLATSSATEFRLEYGLKNTTCSAVGTWTDVGAPGGSWAMVASDYVTDGEHTTNIPIISGGLTDPGGTFTSPNSAVKDVSSQTTGILVGPDDFVELEYTIEATTEALSGEEYCFRVSSAGSALDLYTEYAEASMRPNQDFIVQRGVATIPDGDTTASLIAGTDFVAPRDSSRAFIRITNTHMTGAGNSTGGGNQDAHNVTAHIANPEDLANTVNIVRFGTAGDTRVAWELVEYIGPPGGDNEIRVRTAGATTFGAGAATSSMPVTGVLADDDVVVFVTGSANPNTGRTTYQTGQVTGEWSSAYQTLTLRRGATGDAIAVSYALVEFVGQNWRIQRAEHTYSAVASVQTQTISAVGDLSRAFIHAQKRISGSNNTLSNFGHVVYFQNPTTVNFFLESGATNAGSHTSVAWIIENTQTSGVPMQVTRSNGTQSGGGDPAVVNVDINTTLTSLDTASIFMTNTSSGNNTQFPRAMIAPRIISPTQYEIWISDAGQTRTYRTEVVEWPTAQLTLVQNYYRVFVDNEALTPGDPWPLGAIDLGENTAITADDAPPSVGQIVRLRMSVAIEGGALSASARSFALEYGERPEAGTCSMITEWFSVGEVGSTTALWRGIASGPPDGTPLSTDPPTGSDLLLSIADRAGTYERENPSALNPYRVANGEDVEYDWVLQHNGASEDTFYCFRMTDTDGSLLDEYAFYPTILTGGFEIESHSWRWYGDVTNLTPTTALAAENVTPINIAYDQPVTLRLGLREISSGSSNAKFRLQFSEYADFSVVSDVTDMDQCVFGESTWCYAEGAGDEGDIIEEALLSGVDACTGSVGDGCGTRNEYSFVPEVIGESGTVTADSNPVVVNLEHTYTSPIIIAESITGDVSGGSGNRPAAAMIVATSSNSFTVRIQRPDNEPDTHGVETVSYIVMEAGTHILPGGVQVDAGYKTTGSYYGNAVTGTSDDTCVFNQSFAATPVVLTALQSNANTGTPDFLNASQYNVTSTNFACSIEVPDGETNAPSEPETIGWIAFEGGTFVNNGSTYLVATTTQSVAGWANTPWHTEVFPSALFATPPRIVASKQTRFGGDGGWVRYDELTATSVRMAIDERDDGERFSAAERVGYVAFSSPATIIAPASPTFFFDPLHHKEFAFTIVHAGAAPNRTYYFRAFDVGNNTVVSANASSSYPSLSTEGSSLTFTVSGIADMTHTQGITTSIPTTATSVPFGTLAFGTSTTAAQRLTISTNAPRGYQVLLYQRQDFLSGVGASIPGIAATNLAPQSWTSACDTASSTGCWGYRTGDAILSGGSTRFLIQDRYAALTSAPEEVGYSSVPADDDEIDIVYRLEVTNRQPAGHYETELGFIVIPTF